MAEGFDDRASELGFVVEVRRPLHMENPFRRLSRRWNMQRARRRGKRAARRDNGNGNPTEWTAALDGLDAVDEGVPVVLALVAVVALVAALVLAGPLIWVLVVFVVELLAWGLFALVGIGAWLVLRRPWRVVVLDRDGSEVAAAAVRGRRAAHAHAADVEGRLALGLNPISAVVAI